MCYEIIPTDNFQEDIEFYIRKKKYRKIMADIQPIIEELKKGNLVGTEIPELELPEDEHGYKVRAVNSSANMGKSNGFRVIYYVVKNDKEIYLLTIYSKKDTDLSKTEIKQLIKEYVN